MIFFQKIKNRLKAVSLMSVLFFLFVNCSSHKLGSVLNSDTKNQTNTTTSDGPGARTPIIPTPTPTPNPITDGSPTPQPVVTPTPNPTPSPVTSSDPGFYSLHQQPVSFTKSSHLDASGNLVFDRETYVGFKNQFAPSGVTGCTIGYPEFRSQCETVQGGFGFVIGGYTGYHEYKIYIPAGTTFFGAKGYLPQSVQYAVSVRLGQPPVRTEPLSDSQYQETLHSQNSEADFYKLQKGQEIQIAHDGGGNISLSGSARLISNPFPVGQWLYIRVINGDQIYNLTAIYEVELNLYKQHYTSLVNGQKFNSNNDPL